MAIPVLGKELEQQAKPDDAVAWEPASRQWFNMEQLVFFLENEQSRQRSKFARLPDPVRVRGAHFAGAAAAMLLKQVTRKNADTKMIKDPIDIGDELEAARKTLPGIEEILDQEAAALQAALADEEDAGAVPGDRVVDGGSEQPIEDSGKKRIG